MIERLDINNIEDNIVGIYSKDKIIYDINNNPYTNYYVYKEDNKIVGFINYQVMYERSELINIDVLEEYRNKGIASKLLEFMFNDLKEKKVESISLEVKIDNIKAINLYKKYDFKDIGIRKGYYQGIDGILMKKELM